MGVRSKRSSSKSDSDSKTPSKLRPSLDFESGLGYPSLLIAGVDEVGRGCLAGPVVAAAVVLPPVIDFQTQPWLKEVTDSKLLDETRREELAPRIQRWALGWTVAEATVPEIDRINIFHAAHLAMERAVQTLDPVPSHVLVDGKFPPKNLRIPCTTVIKGDLKCLSIACASIIAKVWRDQKMASLEENYPGYGLASNKGYPTPQHKSALRKLGVTPIHRRSFAPVKLAVSLASGSSL